jgi:TatD DNase family protein
LSLLFTDSHLHFDTFEEEGVVPGILERATAVGVVRMVAIGGSDEANLRAVRLAGANPETIRAVVGYDRDEAETFRSASTVRELVAQHPVAGIGETGLDYHYSADTRKEQLALFSAMLELAGQECLPVVVHSREADEDTLRLLREHASNWTGSPDRLGVLHCFTGGAEFARDLLEIGYYISFSGIVTFKRADGLRRVAAGIPSHRLLIETDAPYLAPMPYRGKRNEPAYVVQVAEAVASARGCSLEETAKTTSENAARLFGFHDA